MKKFTTVGIGGTFDRLHAGHTSLITFALSKGEHVVIGITSDEYIKKKKLDILALPFEERKKELQNYIDSIHATHAVSLVKIDSNDIPQAFQKKIGALVVTDETITGGQYLNQKRIESGLNPLPLILFPRIVDQQKKTIASTRIRSGEIDRSGNSYLSEVKKHGAYILPDSMRKTLKKPIGEILVESDIQKIERKQLLITVGDITTKTCISRDVFPDVAIVDFVVERQHTFSSVKDLGFTGQEHIYHVENKAGTINSNLFTILAHIFYSNNKRNQKSIVIISGEEDLVVIPVILLAPLGACVIYGQPQKGMIRVDVTEKLKKQMKEFLQKFDRK